MKNTKDKMVKNPYDKIFDDARRKFEQSVNNSQNLEKIDTLEAQESLPIPFPYGGHGYTPFHLK